MIPANELRIGNWVINSTKEYDIVTGIESSYDGSAIVCLDKLGHGESKIEPIELTPEILESAGFVKTDRFYEKDEILLLKVDNVFLYHYSNKSDKRVTLKYLHQLQNLFFSLTSSELEVNIKEVV